MQIKCQMTKINTHLASLTDKITEQHDKLVTMTKATYSLYKYTHKCFCMQTEQLNILYIIRVWLDYKIKSALLHALQLYSI